MREEFAEFYYPTESEIEELWQNGIIIFDTNILLNLYEDGFYEQVSLYSRAFLSAAARESVA